MRVIRWKNATTGVESLNITATGIYFPVGKTDSSFKLKLSMASAGQTAGVDTVRDSSGSRTGYGAMNVSGITETKLGAVVSFATGIVVTAISGTLNAILDDEIAITRWPEVSLGRFPAIEDLVAYCYGSVPPLGLLASVLGVQYTYGAAGWRSIRPATEMQPIGTTMRVAPLSSPTVKTAVDARKAHDIEFPCSIIRLIYRNSAQDGTTFGETTNISAIGAQTITASIEVNGKNFPVRFSGDKSVIVEPGSFAISDPIFIGLLPAGSVFYSRTHAEIAGGLGFCGTYGGYRTYEGVAYNGSDISGGIGISGYIASTGDVQITPFAIVTRSNTGATLFLGDSITYGIGDSGLIHDPLPPVHGWARRCAAGIFPSYVAGYPGGTLEEFLDASRYPSLSSIIPILSFNRAVIAFGANDCLSKTSEQIKASFTAAIGYIKSLGINDVRIPLILPRTTSTDSWATVENQTPRTGFEVGGVRDQVNAWISDLCDGAIDGFIDTCTDIAVGSAWLPGKTTDGAHPVTASHAIIAANAASVLR